jgi:hypothetical protein
MGKVLCALICEKSLTGGAMESPALDRNREERHLTLATLRRLRKRCGVGSLARVTGIPGDTIQQLFAGKADPPASLLRKLVRLERLLLARECVSEYLQLGLREFQIAKLVGLCKTTICHILHDDFWGVAEGTCQKLKHKLSEHNAALFRQQLRSIDILPFETSGPATDAAGWKRRAQDLRCVLANCHNGALQTRRRKDFQAIVAQLRPSSDHERIVVIWARGRTRRVLMRSLRHEARHIVEWADDELHNSSKRQKNKALLRICK